MRIIFFSLVVFAPKRENPMEVIKLLVRLEAYRICKPTA